MIEASLVHKKFATEQKAIDHIAKIDGGRGQFSILWEGPGTYIQWNCLVDSYVFHKQERYIAYQENSLMWLQAKIDAAKALT